MVPCKSDAQRPADDLASMSYCASWCAGSNPGQGTNQGTVATCGFTL
jgi:hypothetical protein